MQSGTVDELVRPKFLGLGRDGHRIRMGGDPDDSLVEADIAGRLLDVFS